MGVAQLSLNVIDTLARRACTARSTESELTGNGIELGESALASLRQAIPERVGFARVLSEGRIGRE